MKRGRHDDIPESVKLPAPAAQYLWDHKTFSGITLATRRRVVRREQDGKSAMSGLTLIGWISSTLQCCSKVNLPESLTV
jgi:hypothetical protein